MLLEPNFQRTLSLDKYYSTKETKGSLILVMLKNKLKFKVAMYYISERNYKLTAFWISDHKGNSAIDGPIGNELILGYVQNIFIQLSENSFGLITVNRILLSQTPPVFFGNFKNSLCKFCTYQSIKILGEVIVLPKDIASIAMSKKISKFNYIQELNRFITGLFTEHCIFREC